MEYDLKKISNSIQKKKKLKKYLQIIIILILFIIFLCVTFLINYDQDKDEPNNFWGLYVFDIVSPSMVPTLNENDIIIVKKVDLTKINEKDIITFRKDNKIISHRVIKIEKEDGENVFVTKGDNNISQDNFVTSYDDVYGKVLFKISGIGKQVRILHDKNGLISIIILVVLIFFLHYLKERKKNLRKKTRWKYETKKKREKYLKDENEQ